MERELASPSLIYLSRRVMNHSLHGKFLNLLQFLLEKLQHTQEKMNRTRLSGVNFTEKVWSKSFSNAIFHKRVSFWSICTSKSRQNTQFFSKLFTGATESGRSMGVCSFGNILPINVPKCHRSKFHVFWWNNFQSRLIFTICNPVSNLLSLILLKPWTTSFKKTTVLAKALSPLKCLEEHKS